MSAILKQQLRRRPTAACLPLTLVVLLLTVNSVYAEDNRRACKTEEDCLPDLTFCGDDGFCMDLDAISQPLENGKQSVVFESDAASPPTSSAAGGRFSTDSSIFLTYGISIVLILFALWYRI